MKSKLILLFLFLSSLLAVSQENRSSNTYIQTCVNNQNCYSINNSSFIYYDENSHFIFLKVDFTKFKTNVDSIDAWLMDLTDSYLYFKAPLNNDFFLGLGANGHKNIKLNGWIFLNGVWKEKRLDFDILSGISGGTSQSNTRSHYDQYKVNFNFSFLPREFKVNKKPHHLKKSILIAISMGTINLIQTGMGPLILGEAFSYHP